MSFYDHRLHNEYQQKINNETNIQDKLFKELEVFKKIIQDETNYPNDQESISFLRYPLAGNRIVPELTISDYIMTLNNYKTNGYLFTMRYLNSDDAVCEVIYLDPNDNGQIWLFVIASNFNDIEEIKKYGNINLETELIDHQEISSFL